MRKIDIPIELSPEAPWDGTFDPAFIDGRFKVLSYVLRHYFPQIEVPQLLLYHHGALSTPKLRQDGTILFPNEFGKLVHNSFVLFLGSVEPNIALNILNKPAWGPELIYHSMEQFRLFAYLEEYIPLEGLIPPSNRALIAFALFSLSIDYVILHEIAHHALQHNLLGEGSTDGERRLLEFEADAFAAKIILQRMMADSSIIHGLPRPEGEAGTLYPRFLTCTAINTLFDLFGTRQTLPIE